MNNRIFKLALGSAQWGLDYGISNTQGRPALEEVKSIISIAQSSSIELLDTAQQYGGAEIILAEAAPKSFRIVTKISSKSIFQHPKGIRFATEAAVMKSLMTLKTKKIYGILIHDLDILLASQKAGELFNQLKELRERGFIEKIGVSAYSSHQINHTLSYFIPDIVQAPVSVFDQRLILDNTFSSLKELGIEIHARSAFLQGLLLMKPDQLHQYFLPWKYQISKWQKFCLEQKVQPFHMALSFVCDLKEIDYCIVGVENSLQLKQLLAGLNSSPKSQCTHLAVFDERLLNPSLWQVS